jgi:hypothetical protein
MRGFFMTLCQAVPRPRKPREGELKRRLCRPLEPTDRRGNEAILDHPAGGG